MPSASDAFDYAGNAVSEFGQYLQTAPGGNAQMHAAGHLVEAMGEAMSGEASMWDGAQGGWTNEDTAGLAGAFAGELIVGGLLGAAAASPFLMLPLGIAAGSALAIGLPAGALIAGGILFGATAAYAGGKIGESVGKWMYNHPDKVWLIIELCPLVLDLDGDGLELVSLDQSQVQFDMDTDGFAEWTGWVGPNDGMLAMDHNGNGAIENVGELFGGDVGGFTALATLDSNSDGVINDLDAEFGQLLIWTDLNQNGFSEANEMRSLAAAGINSVSLSTTNTTTVVEGHEVRATATFDWAAGGSGTVGDVWFQNSQVIAHSVGDTLISAAAIKLPTLRGSGEVLDLRVALSSDPDLLASMQALFDARNTFQDYASFRAAAEPVIMEWLGVLDLPPVNRGDGLDSRHLVGLERLMGQSYGTVNSHLTAEAARRMEGFWDHVVDQFTTRLLIQMAEHEKFGASAEAMGAIAQSIAEGTVYTEAELGALVRAALELATTDLPDSPLLATYGTLHYDALFDVVQGNVEAVAEALSAQGEAALADPNVSSAAASGIWRQFFGIADTSENAAVMALVRDAELLFPLSVQDAIRGFGSADALSGTAGGDILVGNGGDDQLAGAAGDDVLSGGTGNDILSGEAGADRYAYRIGDGHDTIAEAFTAAIESDTLAFGTGLEASDLVLARSGTDLIISFTGQSGSVTLQGHDANGGGLAGIETVIFGDDLTWTKSQLGQAYIAQQLAAGASAIEGFDTLGDVINGSALAETFTGLGGNDLLDGAGGNDQLYGGAGSDTLSGGAGDDVLIGGQGDDTYVYALGDGADVVADGAIASTDELRFDDIDFADMTFGRSVVDVNDLVISFAGGSVRVDNQFDGLGWDKIETFVFADQTLTSSQLNDWILDHAGTSGDETIRGFATDDQMIGRGGDDFLIGGGGNDTYVYSWGDGNDTISDGAIGTVDALRILGVDFEDMTFARAANDANDLIITFADGGSIRIDDQFDSLAWFRLEVFDFGTGATYSAADILGMV